jgi:hypothetical protein
MRVCNLRKGTSRRQQPETRPGRNVARRPGHRADDARMRVVVAGLVAPLAAAAPASTADGLTRGKAERLVERKAKAKHPTLNVDARCTRSGRRTFRCSYRLTSARCDDVGTEGRAQVTKRPGRRTSVRLIEPTVARLCDDSG